MKSKSLKLLYKKEMLDVLRDKKTVIMMLVVPLVLYPLIFVIALLAMNSITRSINENTYRVAYTFEDAEGQFKSIFDDNEDISCNFELIYDKNPEQMLEKEQIDAYIERDLSSDAEGYIIHYNSSINNSSYAYSFILDAFKLYSNSITKDILVSEGYNPDDILSPVHLGATDTASEESTAGNLLSVILPFMLIISLMMGTMYPAIDTTAGERERGTLETLLTLPISNKELIFSKFLTVTTIGIASAILNIIAMAGIGAYMYGMVASATNSSVHIASFVPAFLICVLCVLAFAVFISAISMCFAAFAKTYKEANNYITPLTLIVTFLSMAGMLPNVTLSTNMALMPVANIALLIRDLLMFKFNIQIIAIVLISNIAYGVFAILFLSRIYSSENVLFGESGSEMQLFERRSNMRKGGVPRLGDMWLVLAIVILALIYIGGAITVKSVYVGTICTQLIIIGLPLLTAIYTKKDLRETFFIKGFKLRYLLAAICLIVGALFIGMLLTSISYSLFGENEPSSSVTELLGDKGFIPLLLIVGVMPAICEEMMFRGFVFSAISAKIKPIAAVAFVGIVFGTYHMSLTSFLTTAFLGMIICLVTYKSKSIFPGMLMHCINNSLACVMEYYPSRMERILPFLSYDSTNIAIIIAIGVIFMGVGLYILFRGKDDKFKYDNVE